MKRKLIWILALILLVSNVFAQPPFQEPTSTNPTLDIFFPTFEHFTINKDFDFHVHVYNASGILLRNDTTTCFLHLYNHTGNHILETQMNFDSNNVDFQYDIGGGNFSRYGEYNAIVWCNNTAGQGGFKGGISMATESGNSDDPMRSIAFLISLGLFAILMFVIASFFKDSKTNDDGIEVPNVISQIIKIMLIFFGIFTFPIMGSIGLHLALGSAFYNAATSFYKISVAFVWIWGIGISIFIFYHIIMGMVKSWRKKQNGD